MSTWLLLSNISFPPSKSFLRKCAQSRRRAFYFILADRPQISLKSYCLMMIKENFAVQTFRVVYLFVLWTMLDVGLTLSDQEQKEMRGTWKSFAKLLLLASNLKSIFLTLFDLIDSFAKKIRIEKHDFEINKRSFRAYFQIPSYCHHFFCVDSVLNHFESNIFSPNLFFFPLNIRHSIESLANSGVRLSRLQRE